MNFWFYPNMVTILTIGLKSHGQNGLQLSYLDPFYFLFICSRTCHLPVIKSSNILMA